ncbi:energy transducer TonB [Arcobacter sp.]|uniref:energy transducer TonB n=1 Tax=Arcobacter sp. TaxID=1872629 RepID=UPI003D11CBD7
MKNKKRYTYSFLTTICIYIFIFFVLFFSFREINQIKTLKNEKIISMNHISLIEQEKKEIKKEEKESKKEVIEKPIEKKEKIKPQKKEPQKIEKVEKVKEQKKDKEIKEDKKEQEAIKKSSKRYEEVFLDENLQKIVQLIQKNVIYPRRAREYKIQGKVLVLFKILISGEVEDIKAISGHRLLIKSAIEAIKEASKEFPKVEKEIIIKVPIQYTLT